MTPKQFHSCLVERSKLVKRGTVNVVRGEMSFDREETVTEPCNVPLFGDREKKSGVCNSCFSGSSAEGNMPTPRGLKQIAEAQ